MVFKKHISILSIVLGLIAGLHNLSGSVVEYIFPYFAPAHGSTGGFNNAFIGVMAIIFAIITIYSVFLINKKPNIAGYMLIISAFGGLISVSLFYIISFFMALIAGIMCIFLGKKRPKA